MRKNRRLINKLLITKRILAFIIDFLIINMLIAYPFSKLLTKLMPEKQIYGLSNFSFLISQNNFGFIIYAIIGLIMFLTFFYFVLFEYIIGQTIGKIIMDLKVVSIKENRNNTQILKKGMYSYSDTKLYQVIIRSLFLIPIFPFSLLLFIEPIYLFFFSENEQRLTEKISHTKVIDIKFKYY
jgi:hypothetical protein